MNAIVFNNLISKIPPIIECVAFRAAYIFSKNATIAGDSGTCLINFEQSLKRMAFDYKVKMLINAYTVVEPEFAEKFVQVKSDLKKLTSIKHKNSQVIVLIKQYEKIVNTQYDIYVEDMIKQTNKSGFAALKPLSDKRQLYYLPVSTSKLEETNDPNVYNCSAILKYIFEEPEEKKTAENKTDVIKEKEDEDESFLFFFTPEFFDYTAKRSGFVNIDHITTEDKDAVVSEHFFSLPNINLFSALELESVRASLTDVQDEWHDVNSEWIRMSKDGSPGILNFFKEKIIPLKEAIQAKIDANDIIQNANRNNKKGAFVKIYMGLVPIKTVYDFYFTENVVKQETMDILNDYLKTSGKENYRVPFMAIKSELFQSDAAGETQVETVVSVKKYLDID